MTGFDPGGDGEYCYHKEEHITVIGPQSILFFKKLRCDIIDEQSTIFGVANDSITGKSRPRINTCNDCHITRRDCVESDFLFLVTGYTCVYR